MMACSKMVDVFLAFQTPAGFFTASLTSKSHLVTSTRIHKFAASTFLRRFSRGFIL